MTTSITYPNGQVLSSSALTPDAVNKIIQPLTCGVLGINPPDYSKVRVGWQTQGQPFTDASVDVCFVLCVPEDVEYSRVRDRVNTSAGEVVTENWLYTRGWKVNWSFYGPSSTDHARSVRSAFFMDYANDQLNLNNLYPLSDPPEIERVPEEINGQWFERADFHVIMYEQVTETINDGAVTSVEVRLYDKTGLQADFTVTEE